jgi:hypothetical protein
MKTAVDRVQQGKKRVINTRFYALSAYYRFDPEVCNVASGWEKGKLRKTSRTAAGGYGTKPDS